jgi:2-oxoglutarate ferredoxin oxidoreductase subunit alpha
MTAESRLDDRKRVRLDEVVIRLSGDSGDGMQLTGDRLTSVTALAGNDLATLPNFPAEIRAPAGTVAGVSTFQLHFADFDIYSPGDEPDVLVAMNAAALKANLGDLKPGGTVILNSDGFDERNLQKAGYDTDPRTDGTLEEYKVYEIPMTKLTVEATTQLGVKPRDAERSKNFFALGLLCWLYSRPVEPILQWIDQRFGSRPLVKQANEVAFKAGYNFGETAELFEYRFEIPPAHLEPGLYRSITGNTAMVLGLVTAAKLAGVPLFYGSYPITPASDILEQLAALRHYDVMTFQAEDEISAAGAALGASYAGCLGVTGTSGPGIDLKSETVGLAVALELPLIVIDVQRAGPSTGLPTKTEQSDLLATLFGRHGESPVVVLAPKSPSDCFGIAIEAVRIAIKYRTPVYILSETYLANSSEPWKIPDPSDFPPIELDLAKSPNHDSRFWPYLRDPKTLARAWAVPGTPGLMHRIGGLEKEDGSGNVSYDPENHHKMTYLRAEKISRVVADIPDLEVEGDPEADLLVLGWGATYGPITSAVHRVIDEGGKVAQAHLRYLNPMPSNTGEVLSRYKRILVPEVNTGQLAFLLRARFLVDPIQLNKVRALPLRSSDVEEKIWELLKDG